MKLFTQSILLLIFMALLAAGTAVYFSVSNSSPDLELAPEERLWLEQHGHEIRIAPLPDSPPIEFIDEDGIHQGLTADYVNLIEEQLNIRFIQMEYDSWKEIIEKLKSGEIDLVGSVQNTEERRDFLRFTKPYLSIPNVILTRTDAEGSFDITELNGLRIAIVNGSATHDHLTQRYPTYEFVPVNDAPSGLRMLSFGEVDVMVADQGVASFYNDKMGFRNLRVASDIDYPWELCLASRKDWPFLNTILDKTLASIAHSQHKAIKQKWITLTGMQIVPRDRSLKIIGITLLLTLLATGSVTLWNRILKKQVRHHSHELGRVRHIHQQATQALDESEERFRALVESSNDMIWEMDRQGNFTYISPRVRSILGYEPKQLIGQSILSFMIPADATSALKKLRSATADTTINSETSTYLHKEGRRVVLETSGMAFTSNTGLHSGFRGVSRDITERIEAEAALKESEERFRNLVETTSDWIWEVDTQGNYTYASPQIGDLLGYTPSELIGEHFSATMPPKEAAATKTLFTEIAEQGAPIQSLVNINRHKDGRIVVLETSAVPFYDKNWNIQGYRGIDRDITERMTIEKQLEFERNLFRSFMEHAPDLIYFKDADGRFIEVNTAKANEVHLNPEDVVGKTDSDFLPEEQAQRRFDEELEVMRTEKALQKEELCTTADGDRWYLTTTVPRYDERGKVTGTFGTSWDITYRKQAAEELRRLRAQLSNIIDSMPSILVGVGVDGCVTQWNREAEGATQTPASEAVGQPLKEIFPQLSKEMVKVERAIRERATQKEERIPVSKDNHTRYNDITVYPLLENDAEGAVIRVDDVTERVLIEDSIRNIVEGVAAVGRRFFSSMVTQLAKSLSADFTFISEIGDDPKLMRTIAVSDGGKVGKNFEYDLQSTPCAQVMEGKSCICVSDVREQFPNTELLQTLGVNNYIGIPLLDSEGHSRGCMVALYKKPIEHLEFATSIMQVFAGRTVAELERMQATKELLTLRNLLSNIINSMPSILVGVDSQGHVMQWNREAERITGTPALQAQGQPLESVFPRLGHEMDRIVEAIGNRELQHDERIPCIIGDEHRFADVTVYPLTTDGIDGAVIRVDDVTDRVRIEEMMMQSEKMMSVGGLAAGMAHEINNPLAGILQNLQVMRNRITHNTDLNLGAAAKAGTSLEAIQTYMQDRGLLKMMDSVTEAGRRAAKIVDNMLSFSRKEEAHYAPNDLREILERSIELASNDYNLKKRFDFRHIQIDREYDEALGPIPCESSQIQQVVLNLLSNSAQAMAEHPDDSREPRITLRLRQESTTALIEVEDNGPGMDYETRKRAFEPFFTTKEVGHGTGLGLSVSYFIITENHGGTMLLRSAPGRGSCFSIRIPFEHRQIMWGLRL
ncbi:MAG: PAS domain S-box protein [Verrucomicrobiota bacterium]